MKRVSMNCECCRVCLLSEGAGVATMIEYNGELYVGWQRLSEALRMSKSALHLRIQRRRCLLETKGQRRRRLAEADIAKLMHRWARRRVVDERRR